MVHDIDEVLVRPGDAVTFTDRDDLLETLDRLDRRIPGREEGRTRDHREHFCMVRYLQILASVGEELLPLPVILRKVSEREEAPDFVLEWPDGGMESFELTDGSTEEYQKLLSEDSKRDKPRLVLPVDINTPDRELAELWAETLFSAFQQKACFLAFDVDHLLIYDLTGISLLLPLQNGAPLLRQKIQDWLDEVRPAHRFRKVSVLRDGALLLDLTGAARILRSGSPFFQLAVIRAPDEEDLRRRLRELDRYCRDNSIRYLKLFGSVLGDLENEEGGEGAHPRFGADSDLDLLVQFEPRARVTLFDMARMERELGELIGFEVDLRTAEDLSRYFRQDVLDEAVTLHARPA